jgi:hypothetical protein
MTNLYQWANSDLVNVCCYLLCGTPELSSLDVKMANTILTILQSSIGPTLLKDPFIRDCLSQMLIDGSVENVLSSFNHLMATFTDITSVQYINNLKEKHSRLYNPSFGALDPTLMYYM